MLYYGGVRFEFRPEFDHPPFCFSLLQFLQEILGLKARVLDKGKGKCKINP
jgi:hypothetical protein